MSDRADGRQGKGIYPTTRFYYHPAVRPQMTPVCRDKGASPLRGTTYPDDPRD